MRADSDAYNVEFNRTHGTAPSVRRAESAVLQSYYATTVVWLSHDHRNDETSEPTDLDLSTSGFTTAYGPSRLLARYDYGPANHRLTCRTRRDCWRCMQSGDGHDDSGVLDFWTQATQVEGTHQSTGMSRVTSRTPEV